MASAYMLYDPRDIQLALDLRQALESAGVSVYADNDAALDMSDAVLAVVSGDLADAPDFGSALDGARRRRLPVIVLSASGRAPRGVGHDALIDMGDAHREAGIAALVAHLNGAVDLTASELPTYLRWRTPSRLTYMVLAVVLFIGALAAVIPLQLAEVSEPALSATGSDGWTRYVTENIEIDAPKGWIGAGPGASVDFPGNPELENVEFLVFDPQSFDSIAIVIDAETSGLSLAELEEPYRLSYLAGGVTVEASEIVSLEAGPSLYFRTFNPNPTESGVRQDFYITLVDDRRFTLNLTQNPPFEATTDAMIQRMLTSYRVTRP